MNVANDDKVIQAIEFHVSYIKRIGKEQKQHVLALDAKQHMW